MKKLVLGIGNPILGDDGVGFHVVEALQSDPPPGDITFECVDASGFALLDYVVNYDRVVIVDAIMTVDGKPGTVYRLGLDNFRPSKHTISPHDTDLPTALHLGATMKLKLPEKIDIVAVEIPPVYEFSQDLSEKVAAAVPEAVKMVKELITH
ncbi:MAG: hydrogenase maturation protease [Dehalococcoidia bacterium]|jgi:hydrogenase maturation protease